LEQVKSRACLAALYTASGLTGVAYEVLWARMLSMQFGASIFGVVFTVTAFMAGLGLGSLFGSKWRIRRPIAAFALLELSVAIYALILPALLHGASSGIDQLSSSLSPAAWFGFQGLVSLILLMIPATAMGASFPMVLSASDDVGLMYGLNTAGAAIGALLPLGLLPEIGWSWSVRLVAVIGLVIGVGGLMLSNSATAEPRKNEPFKPNWKLFAYAGIGASSLMLQVGWTRLYSLVMLRTEYVLAVILCVYLIGMGLGSLFSRKGQAWLIVLPLVAATFTIASLWLFPHYSGWVERSRFHSLFSALVNEGGMIALMTLPVTLALGAWLPLLSRQFETKGAWLYGINSFGAAFGALLGGFAFVPLFGTPATIAISGIGFLVFGFVFAEKKLAWISLPILALAAYPVMQFPPVSKLLPIDQGKSTDLYRFEDALAVTHVVEDASGQRLLLTDLQRMDASTDPTAVAVQKNQARLPLLLHPDAHSILFLGLGTGISAAGSLPYPGLQRTAVELSEGAIRASRTWFAKSNQNVMNTMTVHRDDARHFLTSTNKSYDVIVGDLFHPDLAGVGALLSTQEFEHARGRLTENGIFVQWLALNQFDRESLEAVLRSFVSVFPNAALFVDGMHLAMVGPNGRFATAAEMHANLDRLSETGRIDATGGEGIWTWIGRYYGPIRVGKGPLQGEWSPHIEYSLPRARFNGRIDVAKLLAWLIENRPPIGDAEREFSVTDSDKQAFEGAYIGAELAARSWIALLQGNDMAAARLRRYAYQANPKDRWIASSLADNMMESLPEAMEHGMDRKAALQKVLEVYPDDVDAIRAMMKLEEAAGETVAAGRYRARLAALSPYDKGLRQ
jgi:spermidine synthase